MPEIHLPEFEGPLDLLLRLIERDDLDITVVSLVSVTDQYLSAIHGDHGVDAQALAEFVAIGAKLIYLKSRALLPRPPEEPPEALEDDEVGRELVDLLREYRRFLEVVAMLEERQAVGLRHYTRMATPPEPQPDNGLASVTMEALCALMAEVLNRTPPERPRAVLPRDRSMTLADRISDFRTQLARRGKFSFRRAVAQCTTRLDIVVSFMAILELIRAGEADATQAKVWGDIEVVALPGMAEHSDAATPSTV
ncbi:segregation/condensation protein A [bacterium]|nr:segregation/condensation protein A [bacterium]